MQTPNDLIASSNYNVFEFCIVYNVYDDCIVYDVYDVCIVYNFYEVYVIDNVYDICIFTILVCQSVQAWGSMTLMSSVTFVLLVMFLSFRCCHNCAM